MEGRPGETLDSIIYPDLFICQQAGGYRFALDPVLLFGFISRRPPAPLIDIGCGSGIIALLLARRWPKLPVVGLEIQESLAEMARRGVAKSHLDEQVTIVRGDARECNELFPPGSFNAVVSNPPYRKPGTGKLPPNRERATARHGILMSLSDLASAMSYLLMPEGEFFLAWKPQRLPELKGCLATAGLRLEALRPVRSRVGDGPFLILCRGRRGPATDRDPENLAPLTIYQGLAYTGEVSSLLSTGVLPSMDILN